MADTKPGTDSQGAPQNSSGARVLSVIVILVGFAAFIAALVYIVENMTTFSIPYSRLITPVVIIVVGVIATRILGVSIERSIIPFIGPKRAGSVRRVFTVTLSVAMILLALGHLGIDFSAYLLSAGIAAVIIGLAAQVAFSNVIAGLMVFLSRPFKVGDRIRIGNLVERTLEGKVSDISFLHTKIITRENTQITVPNTLVLSSPVYNYTKFDRRQLIAEVTFDRDIDLDLARETVVRGVLNGLRVSDISTPEFVIKGLQAEGMVVELIVSLPAEMDLRGEVVRLLKKSCEEKGIRVRSMTFLSA